VAGTVPVVAHAGLCAAHSSVGSVAGGEIGDVVGCSIRGSAVGIRCVASVTFRNAAPQLLQKPCPDWTGFPHW
jgi:hypothetical protein